MSATHKQQGTLERNRFWRLDVLRKMSLSLFRLFNFPIPAGSLSEMSLLCFLNDACDILVRARSQEWDLIRLWTHQGSQWAPENKALCSDRRPVCLRSNYTDCSSAMDTSTHRGFTMEETNRWTPLLNKSSGHIVLFVMLSWPSEISQTGHHKLNQGFFFFLCAHAVFCSCQRWGFSLISWW